MDQEKAADIIADKVDQLACAKCGRAWDVSGQPAWSETACPHCGARQTVPAKLGHFLLIELLGRGGMGAVYRALDTTLNRQVAIKVMQKSLGDDPQFLENFLREARAAAQVSHPNVVQVYSCGQEKGQPYIVMELMEGGRLDQLAKDSHPLDEARVLKIALEVADGLKTAQEKGLLHMDIKPANILFDRHGAAKIADFGLATLMHQQGEQQGEIWGTPYYIAPEKVRKQKVDQRSDMYCLGGTLYHALSGHPPFDGPSANDVVLARLTGKPAPLAELRPDLQPATRAVIERMLEMDPFRRHPTYNSLISDLQGALATCKKTPGRTAAGTARKPEGGGKGGMWLVIGLVALIAIVAGVMAAMRGNNKGGVPARPAAAGGGTSAVQQASAAAAGKTPGFFAGALDGRVGSAIEPLVQGQITNVRSNLAAIYHDLAPDDTSWIWLKVYLGLVYLTDGNRDGEAVEVVQPVVKLETVITNSTDPRLVAVHLARFIASRENAGTLVQFAVNTNAWPAYYGRIAQFAAGMDLFLRQGKPLAAQPLLAASVQKNDQDPQWPYAFAPLAGIWLRQLEVFQTKKTQFDELFETKKYAEADKLAATYLAVAPRGLQSPVADWVNKVKVLERQDAVLRRKKEAAALKKKEEERQQAEQRQREADRQVLTQAADAIAPHVKTYDFSGAAAAVRKQGQDATSAESRENLELLAAQCDRLADLYKQFQQAVHVPAGAPPFTAPELGGSGMVVDADDKEVSIQIAPGSSFGKPWALVSNATVGKMLDFTIKARGGANADQAGALLSLAVYYQATGNLRAAQDAVRRAAALDPAMGRQAARILPGLAPP